MPYDHYLFDMGDMGDVIDQINDQKEEIVSTFFISDTNQVCVVVEREDERIEKVLKGIFEKDR